MDLNNLLSAYQIAKNKDGNLVEDPRINELDSQIQEETPQVNNSDEVSRLETMMSQLDPANQEPQYMKELGKERDVMQQEQYAQDDSDAMRFSDAFEQHYEKVKDLPVEERPKLTWRGREYAPIKADEPEQANTQKTLVEQPEVPMDLLSSEGWEPKVYKDSRDYDTIGYGHKLTDKEKQSNSVYGIDITDGITKEEGQEIVKMDYQKAKEQAARVMQKNNIDPNKLSSSQLEAITEMTYQLGEAGASKFKETLQLIKEGKYQEAATEAAKSDWNKQTPRRVEKFQEKIIK